MSEKHCVSCGGKGHSSHECKSPFSFNVETGKKPAVKMVCLGCGRDVVYQASGYCPPCDSLRRWIHRY